MVGLTVKVFRTYNASVTLQQQLAKLTRAEDNVNRKMLSYNRANLEAAILCNHQHKVPRSPGKAMGNQGQKIKDKKNELKEAKAELENEDIESLMEQLEDMNVTRTDTDENTQFALASSKENYLDPRISVAWCKKFDVPIEKVFNKTLQERFRWAIDMVMSSDKEFVF
ncbi:hypothetical protein ANCCEY_08040 [Ancylostoma ceylanicum]|nr:hypothetical protein ANCCEY_08040 [Ancylostoma ceylanicum]